MLDLFFSRSFASLALRSAVIINQLWPSKEYRSRYNQDLESRDLDLGPNCQCLCQTLISLFFKSQVSESIDKVDNTDNYDIVAKVVDYASKILMFMDPP